jgi:hypothetical protein
MNYDTSKRGKDEDKQAYTIDNLKLYTAIFFVAEMNIYINELIITYFLV